MGSRRHLAPQNLPQRPLAAPLPDSVEFAPPGLAQQPAGTYQHTGSTGVRGQLRPPPPQGQGQQQQQAGRGRQQHAGAYLENPACNCAGRRLESWRVQVTAVC